MTSHSDTKLPTALAEPEPEPLAPVAPVHPAVNAYSLRELAWMAKALAGGDNPALTLPKALQGKPADTLSVMLAGRELGIGPMQATRDICIINGASALKSELKLALAHRAGHDIRPVHRHQGFVAVCCVTHESHVVAWALTREAAGAWATSETTEVVIADEIQVESWEGERGARSKVMTPLVDKTNYQSWGFAMLWARAVGQLCREHCPEAVGGLYSVEELA